MDLFNKLLIVEFRTQTCFNWHFVNDSLTQDLFYGEFELSSFFITITLSNLRQSMRVRESL
jgi:hypothetical protein